MSRKVGTRLWLVVVLAVVVEAGCATSTTSPTAPPPSPTASLPIPSPVLSPALSEVEETVEGSTQLADSLSGVVRGEDGPVAGATVRLQATDRAVTTGSDGRFTLTDLTPGEPVALTAWAPGYYIMGGEEYIPGTDGFELNLIAHASDDNHNYQWLSAFANAGEEGNCQNCHADPTDPASAFPFDEWARDAHAGSVQNPRFLTMYSGTDVHGRQSPSTRYGFSRDYGSFPLRPDHTQPYYGPGYKLDFPDTAGNCAACHAPAASVNAPYGVDPLTVTDVGAEGVACDFCHKVWDVHLDPATGTPYPAMPGVLSFEFRRPPEGHQFFAGPFDDVAPGEDTYSPLQTQSQFCAPCHFGVFWDTLIYNSFGEWLDSPYSDPETGQTCQDCHMPAGLTDHFAQIDRGGIRRDPATIFSHRMPGAMDQELLGDAVTLTATARLERETVEVQVNVSNNKTGHYVPTGSPLRHLILLVEATDGQGQALSLQDGSMVPQWGGVGDPNRGYYAGTPGKAFAKVLEELWTEVSPSAAYWNPTRVLSDNRLAPFATDRSIYTFAAPDEGIVSVEVRLLFRRAYIELMDQKGWDVPDITMAQKSLVVDIGN